MNKLIFYREIVNLMKMAINNVSNNNNSNSSYNNNNNDNNDCDN